MRIPIQQLDAFASSVFRGRGVDFVSRFFASRVGIPEDPVTGAAHCTLIPYWAGRFGRATLAARQISRRGGELTCELRGDRVRIGGRVAHYLEGWIDVPGDCEGAGGRDVDPRSPARSSASG